MKTSPPEIVCLGILVADVIARTVDALPDRGTLNLVDAIGLRGGGGALTTSTWLARSGVGVAAAGKVGADAFGDFILGLLDERGVDRAGVLRDELAPTSASVVLVDSAGERTFLHLPGGNGALRADELDPDVLYAGKWLLLTGALVMPALDGAPAASILAEAGRRGVLTALDTVYDPSQTWERVLPLLPHVDLFLPGIAEARGITGERDPARVARALRGQGAAEVALKLGSDGCYALGEGFEGHIGPVSVAAVDGTGAGDAFNAGLLYGKLAGWPFEQCVRLGNAAGALATTAVGAAEAATDLRELVSSGAYA